MKITKVKCPKCGLEVSKSNYEKHVDSKNCKRLQKRNNIEIIKIKDLEYDEINDLYICPYCGKKYGKKGIATHIWRNHTEDGKKFKPSIYCKDKSKHSWNKGKTKETDERIKKGAETLKKKYESGEIKPSFLGRKHTEETKRKIADKMREYYNNNPDKIPYKLFHHSKGETYPEKYFREFLEKNNIEFIQERRIGLYSLDFEINGNIDLEIDGEQHYRDKRIIESDKKRTEFLESKGYKVIRVRWSEFQKKSENERKEFLENLLKIFRNS